MFLFLLMSSRDAEEEDVDNESADVSSMILRSERCSSLQYVYSEARGIVPNWCKHPTPTLSSSCAMGEFYLHHVFVVFVLFYC